MNNIIEQSTMFCINLMFNSFIISNVMMNHDKWKSKHIMYLIILSEKENALDKKL